MLAIGNNTHDPIAVRFFFIESHERRQRCMTAMLPATGDIIDDDAPNPPVGTTGDPSGDRHLSGHRRRHREPDRAGDHRLHRVRANHRIHVPVGEPDVVGRQLRPSAVVRPPGVVCRDDVSLPRRRGSLRQWRRGQRNRLRLGQDVHYQLAASAASASASASASTSAAATSAASAAATASASASGGHGEGLEPYPHGHGDRRGTSDD